MMLLWILLFLLPVAIVVIVWTKLIKKLRAKIVVTVFSAVLMYAMINAWINSWEMEDLEKDYRGCHWAYMQVYDEFSDWDDCVATAMDYDSSQMLVDCNINHYNYAVDFLYNQ